MCENIKRERGRKILKRIEVAVNEKEEQLILAKITGNFKRGNEWEK